MGVGCGMFVEILCVAAETRRQAGQANKGIDGADKWGTSKWCGWMRRRGEWRRRVCGQVVAQTKGQAVWQVCGLNGLCRQVGR